MVQIVRGTSRDIRVANRSEVLRHILAESPVSRQRVAAGTGLSLATVSNLIGELLDAGILVEVGFEDSSGGRPRGLVSVDPAGGVLIGVDVAETYVHVEVFDAALTPLASAEEQLHPEENRPQQVVAHIVSGVRTALGSGATAARRVLGAGISVPGQVDRGGGVSVFAPNWNWHDVPLRGLLAESLTMPLYLDNPLRAAVVAELWFGAGRGREDVVVLNLGTGVGAGLAFRGSLYRGATNSAGEWGHTTLVLDGRPCHCGGRGCVETYVGAPGIMQHLRELDPDSPMLHLGDQTATIDALARGVRSGDPVAAKVIGETARYLGVAIANLINLANPEAIVLSSWVAARFGEPLLDEVRAVVARHALRHPLAASDITLSGIIGDPVSLGAATLALEGFLSAVGTAPAVRIALR
ncbi:ROK family transcriptional regulator [Rugosimonospora africana]|uniref:Sugar kinase n=1 Tax=Rugosimonospora africana TaxID=556532 RepID=A0A8J3QNJ7_9ACTN|nr:ROK family transcriptional regulator [Rugosimonospora africana]GIH14415.1 sugar kinase [Rugosimonospora africana]